MIELGQLEAHHDEFAKRHTRVVAVSVDGLDLSKKTQQDFPQLTIVADHDHKLVDAVEVQHPGAGAHGEDVAAPTTILVDKHGVVRALFRPTNVASRLSSGEVLAMVDKELVESGSPAAPDPTLKPISEILRDWKYSKRITLDVTDAPLKDVMKELERQSGLHFDSYSGDKDKKLSLKLKNVPFWKAVAETSIRTNLPIWVPSHKKNEIQFASISEYIYRRYQIIGPFHVGIHWAPKLLELNDGKVVAAIVIHAECLEHEGSIRRQGPSGITGATLEEANGKPMVLRQVQVPGKQAPGRGYFVVPEEMFKKKLKLRARFDGEVFLTPEEILVPARAGNAIEFKHFGGVKVRITKVSDDSLEYRIEWDSKLRGADAQKLDELQRRTVDALNGGKPLREGESEEMYEWFVAKAADMRLLHAIDHVVLDKNKKAIASVGETKSTFPKHMTAEIRFMKGMVPAQVRIRLAEKRIIKGLLEFEDVFSATPK